MIQFFYRKLFKNQYYLSQGFRAIFLRIFCESAVRFFKKRFYYRAIIARQKSCKKLANRRAASDEKPTPDVFAVLQKGASKKRGIVRVMSRLFTNDELKRATTSLCTHYHQINVLQNDDEKRTTENRSDMMAVISTLMIFLYCKKEKLW